MTKYVVFDVEGKAVPNPYHIGMEINNDGSIFFVIEEGLSDVLKKLLDQPNVKILLAGIKNETALQHFKKEFYNRKVDLELITFTPESSVAHSNTLAQLAWYLVDFKIDNMNDVYFFSYNEGTVRDAMKEGYNNSFLITKEEPLVTLLNEKFTELTTPTIVEQTQKTSAPVATQPGLDTGAKSYHITDSKNPIQVRVGGNRNGKFAQTSTTSINAELSENAKLSENDRLLPQQAQDQPNARDSFVERALALDTDAADNQCCPGPGCTLF